MNTNIFIIICVYLSLYIKNVEIFFLNVISLNVKINTKHFIWIFCVFKITFKLSLSQLNFSDCKFYHEVDFVN